jgi:hypothetical protein
LPEIYFKEPTIAIARKDGDSDNDTRIKTASAILAAENI